MCMHDRSIWVRQINQKGAGALCIASSPLSNLGCGGEISAGRSIESDRIQHCRGAALVVCRVPLQRLAHAGYDPIHQNQIRARAGAGRMMMLVVVRVCSSICLCMHVLPCVSSLILAGIGDMAQDQGAHVLLITGSIWIGMGHLFIDLHRSMRFINCYSKKII